MSKKLRLVRGVDIQAHRQRLIESAARTRQKLAELLESRAPDEILYSMKFGPVGCDPFDPDRNLNLVEQLNQHFTYLASLKASDLIFELHPKIRYLELNLGTRAGWDIESEDDDGLCAEVFAAVTPANNRKLRKDIDKVKQARQRHRYVMFMCPEYKRGPWPIKQESEVTVWSLGYDI